MSDVITTEYVVAQEQVATVDIAADIGNARAVVLVRKEGEDIAQAVTMPAVRSLHGAFSWEVFASRGLSAGAWGSLKRDEHIIERGGHERFLGRLAVERSAAASSGRGSDARYYDGTTLDFILAGVASAVPGATKIIISRLVTVLPISLWHLSARVVESTRGVHRFSYNGRGVSVDIRSVQVKREGEAAFATIEGDTSGKILVIDGGGRTVNLALFSGGEYRAGATLELGVEAALDNVDKVLLGQGARALTLSERGELLDCLVRGKEYAIVADNRAVRVDTAARAQFDATAAALVQEMRAKVAVEAAQRIVFVGGAAYPALFGEAVKRALPLTQIGSMPELANAYGAMAIKKGGKKR